MKNEIKRLALSFGYVIKKVTSHSSGRNFVEDFGRLIGRTESPTVFDVGANIGQTTRRFRSEFPSARIYSFEPVRNTYEQLKNNLNGDSLTFCFNIALGTEKGQAEIYKNEYSELNSFKQQHFGLEAASQTEVVQIETLDRICAEEGVSTIEILKSDTEGFDLEVLKGGGGLFSTESIKAVVAEATFDFNDLVHTNFFILSEFLLGYGFSIMSLYDMVFRPGSGKIDHFNVMYIHRSLNATLHLIESAQ